MENQNSVILTGHAGSDPEVKSLEVSGHKVAKVSICHNEYFKNSKGQIEESLNWFNLVFWNEKADLAEQLIKKGTKITIEGKLSTQNYIDKNDIKRTNVDILVSKITVDE